MASTYSPLLRLELIGSGDQAGLWGNTTNNNLGALLEQAIAGVGSITLTASTDYTLTSLNGAPDNARNAVLTFSGSPGATTNIVIPASQKLYVVRNGSASDLIFKTSAQVSGVTVKSGDATLVFCDGASALPGIATANVGTLSVSGGGTGVATFTAGVLKSPGGTTALTTGAVALGSAVEVSGILGASNGGTGLATVTANGILLGNGVSPLQTLVGTAIGQLPTWNGTTWAAASPTVGGVGSFNGRVGAVVPLAPDYASYYPSLTGGGASGSWGINITGNAATASSATTAATATLANSATTAASCTGNSATATTATTAGTCTGNSATATFATNAGNATTVTNGVYTNTAQNITGNKQFSGGIYGGGVSGSTSGVITLFNASSASSFATPSIYDGRAIFYQNGTYGPYVGACASFIYTGSGIGGCANFSIGKTSDSLCVFSYDASPFTSINVVGTITTDGSSTTYGTTSDYRLKTVLGSISDAVDRIKRLKPIQFKWKANDELAPVDGFLAHEVQEVVSNAVNGAKDAVKPDGHIVPQTLDTSFLVPLLTAALQNALSRIEALEAKVGV